MSKSTERFLQVAAGVMILWFGWNLVAGSVIQMVNLNLQNRELQRQLQACTQQLKGAQSSVPHP